MARATKIKRLRDARTMRAGPARVSSAAWLEGAEPIPGYRLVKCLGGGGYGEVWKAVNPTGVEVALKRVKLGGVSIEQRSVELLKNIRHANLVGIRNAWTPPDSLIIEMDLADQSLKDRLREAGDQGLPGIPRDELLQYMREAAAGIDFLNRRRHEFGGRKNVAIQHRDIKPQNLLLVGGSVKVADFGLAKALECSVSQHSGHMTPAYSAPEFFEGKTAKHSDQYSLAVTYCELCGGRLPFAFGPLLTPTNAHLNSRPDLTMLPKSDRPIVAQALEKNWRKRWPSCADFVSALASGSSSPSGASPPTTVVVGPNVRSKVAPYFRTYHDAISDFEDRVHQEFMRGCKLFVVQWLGVDMSYGAPDLTTLFREPLLRPVRLELRMLDPGWKDELRKLDDNWPASVAANFEKLLNFFAKHAGTKLSGELFTYRERPHIHGFALNKRYYYVSWANWQDDTFQVVGGYDFFEDKLDNDLRARQRIALFNSWFNYLGQEHRFSITHARKSGKRRAN